jgi:hypothetical protein
LILKRWRPGIKSEAIQVSERRIVGRDLHHYALQAPGFAKDPVISRLTLRFAFSQIALRMNAPEALSLANNSDLA